MGQFQDMLVIELANVLAGPSVGMFFAELGARVIKIESLPGGGDVTRTWKLPGEDLESDISAYFTSVNWGKESLAIDLRSPEGLQIVHQLIGKADVVIASYKPGDAAKLKVDYETLSSLNPALIYAEITGYGPDDSRPAFDAVLQAESGFTFMNGEPNGPPVKMPVALIDVLAGHQLKEAVLLAIIQKMKTGKGCRVETSLFHSALASLVNQAANWLVGNTIPQRKGSSHPNIVPYGTIFYTADQKPIVLAIGNDKQFQKLCQVLSLGNLAQNPQFIHNPDRVKNRQELEAIVSSAIEKWSRDELLAELRQLKVPAGAVQDMREVFAQPQSKQALLRGKTPEGRELLGVKGNAFSLGENKATNLTSPPHFNQHGAIILKEFLEYSTKEMKEMAAKKVILMTND